MKEVIINRREDKSSIVALLEDGNLIEKYDNSEADNILEGNIYCGRVVNVLPGMQAAFVDIGEDKNAFIHIKDIIPKVSSQTGNKEETFDKYDIKSYVKQDTPILVQVKKDEENQKGAKISKHISLTGRLSVLMINVDFITISQKIDDNEEKARLKKIATQILQEHSVNKKCGLILRTAAEGKSREEIEKDVTDLLKLWEEIKSQYIKISKTNKPQLIYKNYDIISKFLTSILETDIDRIIVNKKSLYNSILKYMQEINRKDIELILNDTEDLMNINNLQKQIDKISERKIWLKCGGFITIDKTEALTAIDINSGKFIGKKSYTKADTIFIVNKQATLEIAKQLRLRNISGIIIIDYINMETDEEIKEIEKLLENELKKDRSKTQIVGFTKLNLLEMTRKRI